MNKIKFDHNYTKLWKQRKANLIMVRVIFAESITDELMEYDAHYRYNERYDHHGTVQDYEEGYYPLPKIGKMLQLIFIGVLDIPFCTLRTWTPEKEEYYTKLIGHDFYLEVKQDGRRTKSRRKT